MLDMLFKFLTSIGPGNFDAREKLGLSKVI